MFGQEVHGWLEGPDPNYKQVLPLGLFIWNINTLVLNCQCSMVYIFTFGISGDPREEEQSIITTS